MINSENPKKPTRMCVACRKRDDKERLIRIVKDAGGAAVLDGQQKMQCRGVYICKNEECIKKAQKSRAIARGLQCGVSEGFTDELIRSIKE